LGELGLITATRLFEPERGSCLLPAITIQCKRRPLQRKEK